MVLVLLHELESTRHRLVIHEPDTHAPSNDELSKRSGSSRPRIEEVERLRQDRRGRDQRAPQRREEGSRRSMVCVARIEERHERSRVDQDHRRAFFSSSRLISDFALRALPATALPLPRSIAW